METKGSKGKEASGTSYIGDLRDVTFFVEEMVCPTVSLHDGKFPVNTATYLVHQNNLKCL